MSHNSNSTTKLYHVICPDCKKSWQKKALNATPGSGDHSTVEAIYSSPFTTLRPKTRYIRVLTLLSGTSESAIHCELHTLSLDENASFIALSYCWGEEKSPDYISVNGHKVTVGTSLILALKHMRQANNSVKVWVDAICINQQDDDEKAFQVAMMGDIYAQGTGNLTPTMEILILEKHHSYGSGLGRPQMIAMLLWI
jgi:hypothetical protein